MGGLAQNVQKPPPGKNVQNSQGQIFQECQGQITRSRISGMPRSNPKVKWENKNGKLEKMCKNPKVK